MFVMVYFHQKSVAYEEMLKLYSLESVTTVCPPTSRPTGSG